AARSVQVAVAPAEIEYRDGPPSGLVSALESQLPVDEKGTVSSPRGVVSATVTVTMAGASAASAAPDCPTSPAPASSAPAATSDVRRRVRDVVLDISSLLCVVCAVWRSRGIRVWCGGGVAG